MITLKIDVSKIDKTLLYKGQKGTYLDVVLHERKDDYGNDYMVVQGISKEARAAGQRGAILGNGKAFPDRAKPASQPADERRETPIPSGPKTAANTPVDDSIPF